MSQAKITTRNLILNSVVASNIEYNTNYAICRNSKPTSTEVKCFLPSTLINFKSLKDISLTSLTNLGAYNTEINLHIDHDYTVGSEFMPKAKGRVIHFEGNANFLLSGNLIIEHDLVSSRIPSSNTIEAIIPPSSCLNLTLKESITTLQIPFTIDAKLKLIDTGEAVKDVSLSGVITANVVDTDYSEATPCN